ncbi:hypothetical protein BDZ97DRAFT_1815697 [Flammula alnicola]|nr:hypothetical protein BDZ97DRAFT_1815697 [Flammula alnicola]
MTKFALSSSFIFAAIPCLLLTLDGAASNPLPQATLVVNRSPSEIAHSYTFPATRSPSDDTPLKNYLTFCIFPRLYSPFLTVVCLTESHICNLLEQDSDGNLEPPGRS